MNDNEEHIVGDSYFYENAPQNWDLAYEIYTREGAAPLSPERQTAIKDILNHGKFNKRIIILSIIFVVFSMAVLMLTRQLSLFYTGLITKALFIISEILIVTGGVRQHRRNSYSSLRWMLPSLFFAWCVYVFVWLM